MLPLSIYFGRKHSKIATIQVVNAFILMTLAVPGLVLLIMELKVEKNARVVSLGKR